MDLKGVEFDRSYLSADGLYAADEEDRPEVKHVEGVIREEGRVISGENVDDL